MLTLRSRMYFALAALGLSLGGGGCGSGAPEGATSPAASSQLGPRSVARTSHLSPQDPPTSRPSTKEACDACQGLWGAHGIEADETCICKADDEGTECLDGDACRGECLLNDDAEFHVMDQGNPPRGYYKGHCASYDTTFGCFRHIPADIGSQLPLTPEEAGPFICVD
jgi:hypothetical protein